MSDLTHRPPLLRYLPSIVFGAGMGLAMAVALNDSAVGLALGAAAALAFRFTRCGQAGGKRTPSE